MDKTEKLIIIGSGPAGLAAAIYGARGNLNPLVISGRQAGGQLTLTTDVDDFPGFPEGIQGPKLMEKMRRQAERFNTRFLDEDVISVDLKTSPFIVQAESFPSGGPLKADSLIIATGASAMWLGLESEQRLIGHGVSACAVCDALFFRGKNVVVIGGGDTAMREAQHLSKVCNKVTIIHRRENLKAQAALVELIKSKPNIDFKFNNVVEEILGKDRVEAVKLKNIKTKKAEELPIDGVFIAIGHKPNTDFLKGQLDLDEKGYVVVQNEIFSSVKGVFIAGDVADHKYRQAVTAASSGTKAALEAESYLEHHS